MGQNTTSAHFSKELAISDWIAAIKVKLVEEKVKLIVGYFEAECSYGSNKFILRKLSTTIFIELFKVCHKRDVMMVDESDKASEYILEGPIFRVSGL